MSPASLLRPVLPVANRVAVLPFKNLSGDAGQDFFSDGITEDCHHGSRPLLEPARDRQIGDFSVQGVECGSRRDRAASRCALSARRPAGEEFEMMVNDVELHDRMPVVLVP